MISFKKHNRIQPDYVFWFGGVWSLDIRHEKYIDGTTVGGQRQRNHPLLCLVGGASPVASTSRVDGGSQVGAKRNQGAPRESMCFGRYGRRSLAIMCTIESESDCMGHNVMGLCKAVKVPQGGPYNDSSLRRQLSNSHCI